MEILTNILGKDIAKYAVAPYLMISITEVRKNFGKVISEIEKIARLVNDYDYYLNSKMNANTIFYKMALCINNTTNHIEKQGWGLEKMIYTHREIKPNKTMLNIYDSFVTETDKIMRHKAGYKILEALVENEYNNNKLEEDLTRLESRIERLMQRHRFRRRRH